MKSKLFKRAWTLAREVQTRFGGSSRDFFSEALRIAWREEKEEKKTMTEEKIQDLEIKLYEAQDELERAIEELSYTDNNIEEIEFLECRKIEAIKEIKRIKKISDENSLNFNFNETDVEAEIEEKKTHNQKIENETYISEEIKKFAETLKEACYIFSSNQASIYRETKKAYEIRIAVDNSYFWIPKKSCFIDSNKTVAIYNWWIEKKQINVSNAVAYILRKI